LLDFDDLDPRSEQYAARVCDRLLTASLDQGVSDIHIEKERQQIRFRWRRHGVLQDVGACPEGTTTQVLARIKALARLVTYRHDIPQEGRLVLADRQLEARVGTLPTLHGERAVIRLVGETLRQWLPDELGMPEPVIARYKQSLAAASGVVLITGVAGAGKTTTAYTGLRYLLQQGSRGRSLVSLEDPIESEIAGVSQSQINTSVGYSWTDGLKALLRQDPEVMLIGEIRDAETAAVVFQAAMTGQLVISTMHARSAGDAVRRLLDLQVPVHHLRSGLDFLMCQRLAFATASDISASNSPTSEALDGPGMAAAGGMIRIPQVELLPSIEGPLAQAIQVDASSREIETASVALGMIRFRS
jgi:general secretion pathway protein E